MDGEQGRVRVVETSMVSVWEVYGRQESRLRNGVFGEVWCLRIEVRGGVFGENGSVHDFIDDFPLESCCVLAVNLT